MGKDLVQAADEAQAATASGAAGDRPEVLELEARRVAQALRPAEARLDGYRKAFVARLDELERGYGEEVSGWPCERSVGWRSLR